MTKSVKVFMERMERNTKVTVQVTESKGTWTVLYKGKPFSLRRLPPTTQPMSFPTYPKVAFTAPGHAIALCRRLNKLFDTDQFTVMHWE